MVELLETVVGFIVGTVVLKGIVAHAMADYIVKWCKYWLSRRPHRLAYFHELVAHYKTKSGTV